jgi:hypothetical protein
MKELGAGLKGKNTVMRIEEEEVDKRKGQAECWRGT